MWHFELGIKEIVENQKSIFSVLTPDEKVGVTAILSLTSYRRNEYIFKEATSPAGL